MLLNRKQVKIWSNHKRDQPSHPSIRWSILLTLFAVGPSATTALGSHTYVGQFNFTSRLKDSFSIACFGIHPSRPWNVPLLYMFFVWPTASAVAYLSCITRCHNSSVIRNMCAISANERQRRPCRPTSARPGPADREPESNQSECDNLYFLFVVGQSDLRDSWLAAFTGDAENAARDIPGSLLLRDADGYLTDVWCGRLVGASLVESETMGKEQPVFIQLNHIATTVRSVIWRRSVQQKANKPFSVVFHYVFYFTFSELFAK